jgi:hypothetical protein
MNITDVIIIGEDIIGLYTAIRASEKGYNVKIFEKKNKQYFSHHDKIIFSEQQHFMRKLMLKLGVPLETIEHKTDGLLSIIKNFDKMPTALQHNTLFSHSCNILSKNDINTLKKHVKEINHIQNIKTYDAIQHIKKYYLSSKLSYVSSLSTSIILKKMRNYFKSNNGQIFYNHFVQNINVIQNNNIKCSINNKDWNSSIVISTVNTQKKQKRCNRKIHSLMLNMFNISIPIKYQSNKENCINKLKFSYNVHFYNCNSYSTNLSFDIVNDLMKLV